MRTLGFPIMKDIIPEDKSGSFQIIHKVVTEQEVRFEQMRSAIHGTSWMNAGTEPGTYCMLRVSNRYDGIWMSDTWFERSTNTEALRSLNGDVLVAGLGIGMLPSALCEKETINSVTVLEISKDVIRLVAPYIQHPKLTVLQADARIPPFRGRSFDGIYLDIWAGINGDMWIEMKPMLRAYRRSLRKGGYINGWLKAYVQQLNRMER